MQIHVGIWAWFIRLLQCACPQQDSVVRIKGYTILEKVNSSSFSPLPFSLKIARYEFLSSLVKIAACLVYVNAFHAI